MDLKISWEFIDFFVYLKKIIELGVENFFIKKILRLENNIKLLILREKNDKNYIKIKNMFIKRYYKVGNK